MYETETERERERDTALTRERTGRTREKDERTEGASLGTQWSCRGGEEGGSNSDTLYRATGI